VRHQPVEATVQPIFFCVSGRTGERGSGSENGPSVNRRHPTNVFYRLHAGLRSGSQYEWKDEGNRLHFYVIDRRADAQDVRSYVVGVRSLDGAGPQARAVRAGTPASASAKASAPSYTMTVTNSGSAPDVVVGHPGAPASAFASDIYRMTVSVEGAGWDADVQNALVAVKAGESARVPVFALSI
jgi:hypothetical protein